MAEAFSLRETEAETEAESLRHRLPDSTAPGDALEATDRYIEYLPQKPPFLFVDGLEVVAPGESVRGHKTFPPGDPIFLNHLPGRPLVPGVILIEALAQVSGIILVPPQGAPVMGYLAEVSGLRFRRLVHPGERILLSSVLVRRFGSAARFAVTASVSGEVACEGELVIGGMEGHALPTTQATE